MSQRFQPKKLNKDDHKAVSTSAEGLKKGIGLAGIAGAVVTLGVKIGKPALKIAKNIFFK